MPEYPTPGAGISTVGLDKTTGWNQPPPASHVPDEGINHFAGLTKDGLDTVNNPVISGVGASAITATGATITWTTSKPTPAGQVNYGTTPSLAVNSPTIASETGGPFTSHSVALTGLTTGTRYYYRVWQTSAEGGSAFSTMQSFVTA